MLVNKRVSNVRTKSGVPLDNDLASQDAGQGTDHAAAVKRPRFILITQCLQNDFFYSSGCRLVLPQRVVAEMLLPNSEADAWTKANTRAPLSTEKLKEGPLGKFLDETIGLGMKQTDRPTLHVINIRDWHDDSPGYDQERRSYGPHCEPGTQGAAYIKGLEPYLNPEASERANDADLFRMPRFYERGSVRIYHVHSESVFDFKPQSGQEDTRGPKHTPSQLEQLLDILIQGTHEDTDELAKFFKQNKAAESDNADEQNKADLWTKVRSLAQKATDAPEENRKPSIAVIGVYTDIKVLTLLAGLRTRYNIQNLAVSDTLTASPTLERHLAGLDFASKVLGIEVIHGVSDLMRYVGSHREIENEASIVSSAPYSKYQTFFQDKQNVMAYQDEKLREYVALSERRAVDVYERIKRANQFLVNFGSIFLVVTLLAAILSAVFPERFNWKLPLVTGSVSILQLIGAFYTKPLHDLQQNLANLATFKMVLESHSLKVAFARFHLTTPQALREIRSQEDADDAGFQVQTLNKMLDAIRAYDKDDFDSLARLAIGLRGVDNGARGEKAETAGPA